MTTASTGDLNRTASRIAVVSHSHPSISKGGAEISAYALFRGLREIGHDAIFIGACTQENKRKLAFGTPHEHAVYFDYERYSHFYHLGDDQVARQLASLLDRERVGVVNFHHFLHLGLNALRLAHKNMGLRCYLTLHEFLALCHHHGQMVTRPLKLLCNEPRNDACAACFPEHSRADFQVRKNKMLDAFGGFDGFVSPSRFLADRYVAWGLDTQRMTVIENGLLSHQHNASPASGTATRQAGEDARCVIGFFGQINPFKGVDVVLDAADLIAQDKALAQSIEIRIHGNLVGQPEAFMTRFDKTVLKHPFLNFAGPYNSSVVAELMGQCDYVLVPSRWWENSPVVIQEAYAVGVPVICTGIGGLAEKVTHGVTGLHFKLGDAASLVQTFRRAAVPETMMALRRGVPAVDDAAAMARRYAAFMQLDQ